VAAATGAGAGSVRDSEAMGRLTEQPPAITASVVAIATKIMRDRRCARVQTCGEGLYPESLLSTDTPALDTHSVPTVLIRHRKR
jgi:hypothetical protein